ncbi:probable adenylate kinase 7, mitochondrial [Andrographis paniculata]|uniref:probable adenylate kinase 7, mitochondrial n=1 Tax=Andrographis paniculata TaxID=175694 RepID=UPI0021E82BA5|nr:probable adenylate kinase 7, mitochondrial [Andrographis paniculata]
MSALCRFGLSTLLYSCGRRTIRRGYGSAAAALFDCDNYHWFDDDEERCRGSLEESDSWGKEERGVQWVIIGDPRVKRYVYANRLAKLLAVPHISMTSLVRQELNPNSTLYKKIASAVNQGKLVPEDVIFGLLSKRLEEGYCCRGETGFILDGIPRTRMQAEILDQITDIDLVLNLKCTEEPAVKKTTSSNRLYSPWQKFNSIATSEFRHSLEAQAAHFQPLGEEKLGMYSEQRKSLEDYYNGQRKLVNFEVAGGPADTWESLLNALQLQHLTRVEAVTPADSSLHKLPV